MREYGEIDAEKMNVRTRKLFLPFLSLRFCFSYKIGFLTALAAVSNMVILHYLLL